MAALSGMMSPLSKGLQSPAKFTQNPINEYTTKEEYSNKNLNSNNPFIQLWGAQNLPQGAKNALAAAQKPTGASKIPAHSPNPKTSRHNNFPAQGAKPSR